MASPLNVGLVGFGNIGTGVVRALDANREVINGRVPHPVEVVRIVDVDTSPRPDTAYDPAILSSDTDGLLADPDVHVVLELTGTIDFAYELIERALTGGKHVVTANKALMATRGAGLIRIAVDNDRCLLFEAAVGGGIPLIRTLHQGVAANDISAVCGIINGTANYVLTSMSDEGLGLEAALRRAGELGYAEPDPSADVEGIDTAHKLAILATLCFGQDIRLDDVWVEGITRVSALDIEYARQDGYAIKLLGMARRFDDGSVEARVHPTLVPECQSLASVGGVLNAVRIDGNLTGPVVLIGRGAGPEPTASAILSDLMALASGRAEGGLRREMRLCVPRAPKRIRPMAELRTRYYVRFGLSDVPGALGQVLTILGRRGVSVASVEQPAEHGGEYAHVVITTREAREADVQSALDEVGALPISRTEPLILRIEEMD
ncbi:MAG: homoserine dehydrogenase [Phycisphaerales bacterium]|nr:MAG: homoserine dehydrogenase [Phycisphaerales bacterium]